MPVTFPRDVQTALDREAARTLPILAEFDAIDPDFTTEALIAGWSIQETRTKWFAREPKRKTA